MKTYVLLLLAISLLVLSTGCTPATSSYTDCKNDCLEYSTGCHWDLSNTSCYHPNVQDNQTLQLYCADRCINTL